MLSLEKNLRWIVFAAVGVTALAYASSAKAQDVISVDDGYLDYFDLADGRQIDIGALGGGLNGNTNVHKIFVPAQATSAGPWPPATLPSDGRLTGVVHGKLRVTGLADLNGDNFVNGDDANLAFDASWQLVRNTKQPNGASFTSSDLVGPEGTAGPNPTTVNFPHTQGGTNSIWNVAACTLNGGVDVNPGLGPRQNCDPNAPLLATAALPGGRYTGFLDYTFEISRPGVSDFNPGLEISSDNWIITALVGRTAGTGGGVAFGRAAVYNPQDAVTLANGTLFNPNMAVGGNANVTVATGLASVEIVVTPEPATLALLAFGALTLIRSRRVTNR